MSCGSIDVCEVVVGSPYMWDRDVAFTRSNEYRLVKDGKIVFHSFSSLLILILGNMVGLDSTK